MDVHTKYNKLKWLQSMQDHSRFGSCPQQQLLCKDICVSVLLPCASLPLHGDLTPRWGAALAGAEVDPHRRAI